MTDIHDDAKAFFHDHGHERVEENDDKRTVVLIQKLDLAWRGSFDDVESNVDPKETRLEHDSSVLSVHFNPAKKYLWVGLNNGTVQEWLEKKVVIDTEGEEPIIMEEYVLVGSRECHEKGVKAVQTLWDSSVMVTGSYDNKIKAWARKMTDNSSRGWQWELQETLLLHSDAVWDLRPFLDVMEDEEHWKTGASLLLASCGMDGRVNVMTCCKEPLEFNMKLVIQGLEGIINPTLLLTEERK